MTTSEQIGALFGGEWRKAIGENPWWVCADGRVASGYAGRPRLLVGTTSGLYRSLMSAGKHFYIHALICEAFHGLRPAGHEVRHLDGNRLNNAALNLAWGTRAENHADKHRHGTATVGERNPMAKLTVEKVMAMRDLRQVGTPYHVIGRTFGVSTMTAYRAVEMQSWK